MSIKNVRSTFLILGTTIIFSGCLSTTTQTPSSDDRVVFTPAAVQQQQEKNDALDPAVLNPDDYPQTLGQYSKNGEMLVVKYFCSDVCPAAARLVIVYENIDTPEACAELGGTNLIDPAWKGYIGCAPTIEEFEE